jgi:membrane protein implicated in regulation of membrane protease activity
VRSSPRSSPAAAETGQAKRARGRGTSQARAREPAQPDQAPAVEPAAEERRKTSDELLGELAHELSVLVRCEVELTAVRNGPQLRQVAVELAAALAAGAALLLACAALSAAAILALSPVLPSWGAALVVALVWAVIAALLLRHDHPRRLARRFTSEENERALETAERERDQAERAVKDTAQRLGEAVAREAVERELRAGASAAEHLAVVAEQEAEDLLKELIVALLAPGRAGISILERIVGRNQGK